MPVSTQESQDLSFKDLIPKTALSSHQNTTIQRYCMWIPLDSVWVLIKNCNKMAADLTWILRKTKFKTERVMPMEAIIQARAGKLGNLRACEGFFWGILSWTESFKWQNTEYPHNISCKSCQCENNFWQRLDQISFFYKWGRVLIIHSLRHG